jgi:hypothetical protein
VRGSAQAAPGGAALTGCGALKAEIGIELKAETGIESVSGFATFAAIHGLWAC